MLIPLNETAWFKMIQAANAARPARAPVGRVASPALAAAEAAIRSHAERYAAARLAEMARLQVAEPAALEGRYGEAA